LPLVLALLDKEILVLLDLVQERSLPEAVGEVDQLVLVVLDPAMLVGQVELVLKSQQRSKIQHHLQVILQIRNQV